MELRERIAAARPLPPADVFDAFAEVKDRVHAAVIAELGPQLANTELDQDVLRQRIKNQVGILLRDERGIAAADRERLIEEITDDTIGHGPIEKLLADDSVTEIMDNGTHDVWV